MGEPTRVRRNPWTTTWNVWLKDDEESSQLTAGDTMADAVKAYLLATDMLGVGSVVHVCAQGYVGDVHEFACQWTLDVTPVPR